MRGYIVMRTEDGESFVPPTGFVHELEHRALAAVERYRRSETDIFAQYEAWPVTDNTLAEWSEPMAHWHTGPEEAA